MIRLGGRRIASWAIRLILLGFTAAVVAAVTRLDVDRQALLQRLDRTGANVVVVSEPDDPSVRASILPGAAQRATESGVATCAVVIEWVGSASLQTSVGDRLTHRVRVGRMEGPVGIGCGGGAESLPGWTSGFTAMAAPWAGEAQTVSTASGAPLVLEQAGEHLSWIPAEPSVVSPIAAAAAAAVDTPSPRPQAELLLRVNLDTATPDRVYAALANPVDPAGLSVDYPRLGRELRAATKADTGRTLRLLAIGGSTVLAALIALVVLGDVRRRTSEIAVRRCCGASRSQIVGALTIEAAAVALPAAVLGATAGIVVGAFPSGAPAIWGHTGLAVIGVAVALVATIVGAAIAAARAGTVQPALALVARD